MEKLSSFVWRRRNQPSVKAIATTLNYHVSIVRLYFLLFVPSQRARDLTQYAHTATNLVQVHRLGNGADECPSRPRRITFHGRIHAPLAARMSREVTPSALRLNVHCDQIAPKVDQWVDCAVQVERIGFAGYGMMVAEVGPPPGVEVDRAMLKETEMEYEVQPDRVLFMFGRQRVEPNSALGSGPATG